MPVEFRRTTVTRGAGTGGPGPYQGSVTFTGLVQSAVACIAGYQVGFAGQDRVVYQVIARAENVAFAPGSRTVTFDVYMGIRDVSGNWDDPHEGNVLVVVIANTV